MECLGVTRVPEGPSWSFEIKLDGYRLEVVRTSGAATLYSCRRSVLSRQFPYVVEAVQGLPFGTVLDGEFVALDSKGHPGFNLLQNFRLAAAHIVYFAFDIPVLRDREPTTTPERRRSLHGVSVFPLSAHFVPGILGESDLWTEHFPEPLRRA